MCLSLSAFIRTKCIYAAATMIAQNQFFWYSFTYGNSNFENFFVCIASTNASSLVIESDYEKDLSEALQAAFPKSFKV